MLLQKVPDPTVIHISKQIIQRLAREKNRRKHYAKQEADEKFNEDIKDLVYRWLRNNTAFNDDLLSTPTQVQLRKEDCFLF